MSKIITEEAIAEIDHLEILKSLFQKVLELHSVIATALPAISALL